MRALLILLVLALPGCEFYFGGDDDCEDTNSLPAPPLELRNPETGECQSFGGGGGGGGCYDIAANKRAPLYMPDWGTCWSDCSGRDEQTCQASDGCFAVYTDACTINKCNSPLTYAGCWATPPSGPIRGGGCTGLDAQSCSEHDDCSMVHADGCGPNADCQGVPAGFWACIPEASEPPPACVALTDEPSCIARPDCAPLYQGDDCSCDASGCHCNQETFISCTERTGGGSACGPYVCENGQYCEHMVGGAPPGWDGYACKPMPDTCLIEPAVPSCSCLANELCAMGCEQDPSTGRFTLTCHLP